MERPVDIGIKLTLDIGREFQPELTIAGNFKVTDGEVTGWGSAFAVQEAFSRLGYEGALDDGNRIPQGVLETFIGQKILRLSYVSGTKPDGRLRYSDWNLIGSVEEGAHALVKRFKKSLAKGYPKNYRPELLEEAPTPQLLTGTDDAF
jgi:hypothetical protein